jgi:hypothetical protein
VRIFKKKEGLQQPLPPIFHIQVHDQPRYTIPTISIEEEHKIMATKVNPTIIVVATVVENKIISGTRVDGAEFEYHSLTVTTQNGKHWDVVKARKEADKASIAVISNAKKGDVIAFSDCFIQPFIYKGKACVNILAGKATK